MLLHFDIPFRIYKNLAKTAQSFGRLRKVFNFRYFFIIIDHNGQQEKEMYTPSSKVKRVEDDERLTESRYGYPLSKQGQSWRNTF